MNPFVYKFRTEHHYYAFVGSTNHILKVSALQYEMLDFWGELPRAEISNKLIPKYSPQAIQEASDILENFQNNHELFLFKKFDNRIYQRAPETFKNMLNHGLTSICLEVTEDCNLRCHYCIFSGGYEHTRSHGVRQMPIETAITAIDFMHKRHHDPDPDDFLRYNEERLPKPHYSIGFYGGEPLLRYDFIKRCITYARSLSWNQPYRLGFHLTTNAMLLDDEKMDYFLDNNVSLLISFDGPQSVHDQNRISRSGENTFSRVLDRVLRFQEKIDERKKSGDENLYHFGINCVLTPTANLLDTYHFFTELFKNKLQDCHLVVGSVTPGNIAYFDAHPLHQDRSEHNLKLFDKYVNNLVAGYDLYSPENVFLESYIANSYLLLYKRGILQKPLADIDVSPMCKPGKRRPFIDVDGNLHLCERINQSLKIGSVFTDYDYTQIANLWDQYTVALNAEDCKTCFAVLHCNICFSLLADDGFLNQELKSANCEQIKNGLMNDLLDYCAIQELKEDAFKYMDQYLML